MHTNSVFIVLNVSSWDTVVSIKATGAYHLQEGYMCHDM